MIQSAYERTRPVLPYNIPERNMSNIASMRYTSAETGE